MRDKQRVKEVINLGDWRRFDWTVDINGQASGVILGGAQEKKINKKERDEEVMMSLHDFMWFETEKTNIYQFRIEDN